MKKKFSLCLLLLSAVTSVFATGSTDQQQQSDSSGHGILGAVRERIDERTERITDNSRILSSTEPLNPDKPQPGLIREAVQTATAPVKDGIREIMPTKAAPFSQSGFLGSYEGFTEDPQTGAWVWRKASGVLAQYKSFIIAPIIVYPANAADFKGVDPDALKKVTDFFKAELARELSQAGYPIVSQPGAGVGVLRIAIVDIVAGNPIAYAGSWMPYARTADAVSTATGNAPMGAGSISIEAELLDSVSGEREAATIDTLAGKKIEVRQSLNKWGDISQAISDWAKRFANRVAVAHGKQ